jgi:flagellar motor switch protein FliG
MVGRRLAAEGGVGYAQELLDRVLGSERAAAVMSRIDPQHTRPFAYLALADPDVVARVLAPEPPSSIALALAHLEADDAARLLVRLPADTRAQVAIRLASMEHLHPDVVAEVDADFAARLTPMLRQPHRPVNGITTLVELLNRANRDAGRELLDAIGDQDPDLAARIRDALFVFDDIARLDDRSIQQVLRSVDTRDLSFAMKGAREDVSDAILRNLSERARENLLEEIEFLKGVKATDINDARTRIVRAVVALEEAGTITIERGGDEEVA